MRQFLSILTVALLSVNLLACYGNGAKLSAGSKTKLDKLPDDQVPSGKASPPEIAIGEKLFRETRFARYFLDNSGGAVNKALVEGDPTVENLETIDGKIPHPYRGKSISCAGCHLIDQARDTPRGGSRAYTDFARRSPIPKRDDGQTTTPRNSPNMVGSSINKSYLLHADGEFATSADLVRGAFTGRNFGWFASEHDIAIHHVAEVVRGDDGSYVTDVEVKKSYTELLRGTEPGLEEQFRLPEKFRVDVLKATDQEIFNAVAALVAVYLDSLDFARDQAGVYNGSPYDMFLKKNAFPQAATSGESASAYNRRLAMLVASAPVVTFVTNADGKFTLHKQNFVFAASELEGFKVFTGRGHCVACHSAPDFTDHGFHNTGISQLEYDKVHGGGRFAELPIPKLAERNAEFELYLPPTAAHPHGSGIFRSIPIGSHPMRADLGLWNIWQNPDHPRPQTRLRDSICRSAQLSCTAEAPTDAELLDFSIGLIKTPTLRDLGHSAPYLHTGEMDTIEETVAGYLEISKLAIEGKIRNADPLLKTIELTPNDIRSVSAFLRSLNEDYK